MSRRWLRFAWLDYLALLRERKTALAIAFLAYAVLAIPVLFARPPADIIDAAATWFGTRDPGLLFLYVWTDMAMNKTALVLAIVMASDILIRERDHGTLGLLLSKPIGAAGLFLVRAVSACAVVATLYGATQLVGAAYFTATVAGFQVVPFALSGAVHGCAAVFATAAAAAIAVLVGRRGPSMIASLFGLGILVGLTFIGYYQPAWSAVALLNPFALGVQVLAHFDALRPQHVLGPMAGLAAWTTLALALGAWRAQRWEA